jgi:hypothetical protein
MVTRDSWLFSWLAIVIAIAGYFATGGDPRSYTFSQWMQAIVAIGTIILAKLGTSPLPGDPPSLGTVNPRP